MSAIAGAMLATPVVVWAVVLLLWLNNDVTQANATQQLKMRYLSSDYVWCEVSAKQTGERRAIKACALEGFDHPVRCA